MNEDAVGKSQTSEGSSEHQYSCAAKIGFLLSRIIVPTWLLAGAIFKLAELNPNLLPPPVIWTSGQIGGALGQDPGVWLGFSMRFIIGTELMLVGFMYFVPRVSRLAAGGVLGLFVIILLIVLGQGYDPDKGIASLLSGSCGCFGSAGPPPIVMLLIDGLLLLGVLFFRPQQCGAKTRIAPIAAALSILVGYTVAYIVPERTYANPDNTNPASQTDTDGWPLPPAQYEGYYYPQFQEWPGRKLSSIPFMHLLPRPLPEGFDEGPWLVVFYRADCDHCQELFLMNFSDAQLPAPTLAVDIPDYHPESALEFLCDACLVTELPSGPDYLVETPVIVRLMDGVVTCTANGSSDDEAIEGCIYGNTAE